jgi:lactate dehydrogenase-like 2-hydroxyacid dehydrogenase
MAKPEVLTANKLSPFFMESLTRDYVVHEHLHTSDPQALAAAAPRIRAIAASGDSTVSAELIMQLPALETISVMGVGYDGIDVAAARACGITVTHTPDVLNDDVADLALGLMLSVARSLPQADQFVRSGQWAKGPMPLQRKMSGSRLGIVGMGRIGQAIATRAAAFGMPIAYTARNPRPQLPYRYLPNATALAAESDFLVVITPGGAGTRKLINAEVLQALGPQGYVINVARGSVMDQDALIDALEKGVIAGAGLDVFESEPNVPARLLALPNVVLAPHVGSATHQTRRAMADLAFGNLQAHFAGKPLLTPVPECR